ncbi:MAG: hypothetical protein R3A47_09015 [Polyangiales bacterium]
MGMNGRTISLRDLEYAVFCAGVDGEGSDGLTTLLGCEPMCCEEFPLNDVVRWARLQQQELQQHAYGLEKLIPFDNPYSRPELPHEIQLKMQANRALARSDAFGRFVALVCENAW